MLKKRKMATKIEASLASMKMPKPSPARNGKEKREKSNALPASEVFAVDEVRTAFHAAEQAITKPAQASVQIDSQKDRNIVPNKLSGDCMAASPKTRTMLKITPGITKRRLVKK